MCLCFCYWCSASFPNSKSCDLRFSSLWHRRPLPILAILFRPFDFIFPKSLNYLAFQSSDFERIWWRLFQKHVMCTKLDIYVFIWIVHSVCCSTKIKPVGLIKIALKNLLIVSFTVSCQSSLFFVYTHSIFEAIARN